MIAIPHRVRVVHLVLALEVGGLEQVVFDLARCVDRERFEARVVCLRHRGALADRLEADGISVESLDCSDLSKGRTLFALTRRLRQLNPLIVHTHNPCPHLFGTLAARLAGVRTLIHTKHGRNSPSNRLSVLTNRVLSGLSDCIVPVSEAAAMVARQVERVPGHKIRVIHNGIDLEMFPAVDRSGRGRGKRVIHVARLQRIKDQATLLRAARLVADADPDFRLEIAGDGPARDELVALHSELRLGERVRFLGRRDDIWSLLESADLFVLSSLSEGLSISLLEAMSTGLPVVATEVGGNPEVVLQGRTGLLVPPGSPAALAEAMLKILHDGEMGRRMGEAGRHYVEEEFDLRQAVSRYADSYLSLLNKTANPGRVR